MWGVEVAAEVDDEEERGQEDRPTHLARAEAQPGEAIERRQGEAQQDHQDQPGDGRPPEAAGGEPDTEPGAIDEQQARATGATAPPTRPQARGSNPAMAAIR